MEFPEPLFQCQFSEPIRVALSSSLDSSINRNWELKLIKTFEPFNYWLSHLPYGSADGLLCTQFACQVIQLRLKLCQDLDYVLARWITRIFTAKIICIHNKLIKSQSPHKATHFGGQLFQLADIFRFFDFLFGRPLTALVLFSSVQSKPRLLHKRFALKKWLCMVAYACHSKITNCLSIFIVYFSFLYIFFVLIDLICWFFFYLRKGFIFMWIVS